MKVRGGGGRHTWDTPVYIDVRGEHVNRISATQAAVDEVIRTPHLKKKCKYTTGRDQHRGGVSNLGLKQRVTKLVLAKCL